MIYNENGEIIGENILFLEGVIYDLHCLNEYTYNANDEKIKEIKSVLKSVGDKEAEKIQDPNKKFKVLSEKAEKIISWISIGSGAGGLGTLFGAWALQKNFKKSAILVVITAALWSIFLALDKIISKNSEKRSNLYEERSKYYDQLKKLIDRAYQSLNNQIKDKDLSPADKEKIISNLKKIEDLSDKVECYIDLDKYTIGGYKIDNNDITYSKWAKNKNFYEKAIKSFNSVYKTAISEMTKDIVDFYTNDGVKIRSIKSSNDLNLYTDDNYVTLYVYFVIDADEDLSGVCAEFEYDKNGKCNYNWSYH